MHVTVCMNAMTHFAIGRLHLDGYVLSIVAGAEWAGAGRYRVGAADTILLLCSPAQGRQARCRTAQKKKQDSESSEPSGFGHSKGIKELQEIF